MNTIWDLGRAKPLLILVAKVVILTSQLKSHPPFEWNMKLVRAFIGKLPSEKRKQFMCRVRRDPDKLLNLRKYLQDEIIIYAKVSQNTPTREFILTMSFSPFNR